MEEEETLNHKFGLERELVGEEDRRSDRSVTERVHHTAADFVSEEPPASHGHREVDSTEN